MPLFRNCETKGTLGKKGTHGSYLVRIQFVPEKKTTPNYTNYEFMKARTTNCKNYNRKPPPPVENQLSFHICARIYIVSYPPQSQESLSLCPTYELFAYYFSGGMKVEMSSLNCLCLYSLNRLASYQGCSTKEPSKKVSPFN